MLFRSGRKSREKWHMLADGRRQTKRDTKSLAGLELVCNKDSFEFSFIEDAMGCHNDRPKKSRAAAADKFACRKDNKPTTFLQRPEHGIPIGSLISIAERLDVASHAFQENSPMLSCRRTSFVPSPMDLTPQPISPLMCRRP